MPLLGSRGAASLTGFGGLAKLGYLLRNSLRFRSSATAYLTRTPGSASNQRTWTYSGWVKRGQLGAQQALLNTFAGTHPTCNILFGSTDGIWIYNYNGSSYDFTLYTTAVYRDPAAWYHLVVAVDTTQATSSNRVKIYVNGTQITSFTTSPDSQATAYPSLNFNTDMNAATAHEIGKQSTLYFDGYLAEQNFIDGQALTPSSFAKTDAVTGQWIPIKYTGTYGTNGFYLNFNDTSNTTAATLGKDSSGNGNNWTPNNFSITAGATYDPVTDVPTVGGSASNYCVLNPLKRGTSYNPTLSNGNLTYTAENNTQNPASSTIGVSTGSWYYEATITNKGYVPGVGVHDPSNNFGTGDNWRSYINGIILYSEGTLQPGGTSTGYTFAAGDVMGIAFDASSGKVWIAKNNTWFNSGNPAAGTGQVGTATGYSALAPVIDGTNNAGAKDIINVNFGQRAFTYTPPDGFKSLNAYNLS